MCHCKPHNSEQKVKPDEPGPYDVGFKEVQVQLVHGLANVVICYPIEQGYCPRYKQDNIDASDTYSTFGNSFFTGFEVAPFTIPSPLKALKDGPIMSGRFALSIHTHGDGSTSANDPQYSYAYVDTCEYLASHGIISVGFSRLVGGNVGAEDTSALIDYMLSGFVYSNYVDSSKIVVMGHSNGTPSASAISGADADQSYVDSRVKGMVLIEGNEDADYSKLKIPALLFGRGPGLHDYTNAMNTAILSNPRYFVAIPKAGHLTYETSRLAMTNACRSVSLASGTETDPLILPAGDVDQWSYYGSLDPQGKLAFVFWNASEFLGIPQPFVGNLREAQNTIAGVNNKYIDTDLDNDGFPDAPKYLTGVAAGGSITTINLASTIETVNDFPINQSQYDTLDKLNGYTITIVSGTGSGQGRTISAWAGSTTYTAIVDSAWAVAPDATSVYIVTNQRGVFDRKFDGTFENTGILGHDEQVKLYHIYLLSFIKSAVCKDKKYKKFLTEKFANKLKSLGLGSLRIEDSNSYCSNHISAPCVVNKNNLWPSHESLQEQYLKKKSII